MRSKTPSPPSLPQERHLVFKGPMQLYYRGGWSSTGRPSCIYMLYFYQFDVSCADRNGEQIQACVPGACADETTTETSVTTTTTTTKRSSTTIATTTTTAVITTTTTTAATTTTAIQATSTSTLVNDTTQQNDFKHAPKTRSILHLYVPYHF